MNGKIWVRDGWVYTKHTPRKHYTRLMLNEPENWFAQWLYEELSLSLQEIIETVYYKPKDLI